MSEPIPESIPTSSDRRSHRPTKKRALTPNSQHQSQVEALFANPDREISIPSANSNSKSVIAPPEIVANVQGSSAGAGSGEFHVYKASRRREYERLRVMDEEVEREEKDKEFKEKKEEMAKRDAEKLSKNQAKRAKIKAKKENMKKGGNGDGMEVDADDKKSGVVKKKLGAAKVSVPINGVEKGNGEEGGDSIINGTSNEEVADEGGGITFHDND